MRHPTTGELVEFHFGELEDERRTTLTAHVTGCERCRNFVADLERIEQALTPTLDDAPPPDGLERVLERIGDVQPAGEQAARQNRLRQRRLRAMVPSLAAVAAGLVMVSQGGVAGALAFFLGGALMTLALAPILILESQRRA